MRKKITKNGKTVNWDISDYERALDKAQKALDNSIVLGDAPILPGVGWVTIGVYKNVLERNGILARALDLACGGDQTKASECMAMSEEERKLP